MASRDANSLPTRRGRGRPTRSAGAAVTRDALIRRALDIAGREGFGAVTMQRLAREFTVTPRALYNHVRDRQDVIDATAALMMRELPEPCWDAADWRGSLRTAYGEARAAYRAHPRAILISLDEVLTPAEVDPKRVRLAEDMLRFFVDIGLTLDDAIAMRSAFLIDVFGFVLAVDVAHDQSPESVRRALGHPVPEAWLDALPNAPAPLARAATELPPSSSDAQFATFVDARVRAIEVMLAE